VQKNNETELTKITTTWLSKICMTISALTKILMETGLPCWLQNF